MKPSAIEGQLLGLLVCLGVVLFTGAVNGQPAGSKATADIRATIESVQGGVVTIDAGKAQGLSVGAEGTVSYDLLETTGSVRRIVVARFRVTAAETRSARGVLTDRTAPVRDGYHVTFSRPKRVDEEPMARATPTAPADPVAPTPSVASAPSVASPEPVAPTPTAAAAPSAPIVLPGPAAPEAPPPLVVPAAPAASAVPGTPAAPSESPSPPPIPPPCEGSLSVTTSPGGAWVKIDGHDWGLSPLLARPLPCGSHLAALVLEGHDVVRREVVIEADRTFEVSVQLPLRRSAIWIASDPLGADISVDGIRKGATPRLVDDVTWGAHIVRLEKPGFVPLEQPVRVGPALEFAWPLSPCLGRLSVVTDPPGATVVFDGTQVAGTTPVSIPDVRCGSRRVAASLARHEDASGEVTIEQDRMEQIRLTLPPRRSTVRVTVTPADAEVRFGGVRRSGSPAEFPGVAWGSYRLEIEKAGFRPVGTVETVERPGVVEYTVTLERLTASLLLSADWYGAVGGLQTLLSVGLLGSEYALELDGQLALGWRILADKVATVVPVGTHRLRVLIRTFIGREPQVFHDTTLRLTAGSKTEVGVNFVTGSVTINGDKEYFNGPDARLR